MIAGTATLSSASTSVTSSLRRNLHNPAHSCREALDHVSISSTATYQPFKTPFYSHYFITVDDVQETLTDLLTSGFCAWDTGATRAADQLLSAHPASPLGPSIPQVPTV